MVKKQDLLSLVNQLDFKTLQSELNLLHDNNATTIQTINKKIYNYTDLKSYSESDVKSILRLEIDKLILPTVEKTPTHFTKKEHYLHPGTYDRNPIFPILRFIVGITITGISFAAFIFLQHWINAPLIYTNFIGIVIGLSITTSAIWKLLTPLLIVTKYELIISNSFLFIRKKLIFTEIDEIKITEEVLRIRDKNFAPHHIPFFLFSRKDRKRIQSLN